MFLLICHQTDLFTNRGFQWFAGNGTDTNAGYPVSPPMFKFTYSNGWISQINGGCFRCTVSDPGTRGCGQLWVRFSERFRVVCFGVFQFLFHLHYNVYYNETFIQKYFLNEQVRRIVHLLGFQVQIVYNRKTREKMSLSV